MTPGTPPADPLACRDVAEWRAWLAAHHDTETEVWLRIRKAASTLAGVRLDEAVEEALCFGWIDGKMVGHDADSFLLRLTPRRPGSIWSRINRERAERLIAEGRMAEAGMARVREAQENGRWEAAYSSREAPELPADLAAALAVDPEAAAGIAAWSNSQRLMLIRWLGDGKRPETRVRRIATILSGARNGRPPFG
ncbi:MAG: YdeI/OmpD-associated family protein [Anaerolineae bacterium]